MMYRNESVSEYIYIFRKFCFMIVLFAIFIIFVKELTIKSPLLVIIIVNTVVVLASHAQVLPSHQNLFLDILSSNFVCMQKLMDSILISHFR